jgi:hypothetical protein
MKPKIYLLCEHASGWGKDDVLGFALAEDGHGLCSHLSSGVAWSKHDMGLTSEWHHDTYKEHYPNGFELEWVDNPENHDGYLKALALNKKFADEEIKDSFKVEMTFSDEVKP